MNTFVTQPLNRMRQKRTLTLANTLVQTCVYPVAIPVAKDMVESRIGWPQKG